jgi:hypothetical protein
VTDMDRDDYTILECGVCGTAIGRSLPDGIWLKPDADGLGRFFRPDPDSVPTGEIPAYCRRCRIGGLIDVGKIRANTGGKRRKMKVRIRRVDA